MIPRPDATDDDIKQIEMDIRVALYERLERHGYGIFISPHEILGILTEEHTELIGAVQSNDNDHVRKELIDVAVGALFGLVSMQYIGIHGEPSDRIQTQ